LKKGGGRNIVQLVPDRSIRKTNLGESLGVSYISIKNWWNAFEDNGNSFEALSSKKHT
jgi:transposase